MNIDYYKLLKSVDTIAIELQLDKTDLRKAFYSFYFCECKSKNYVSSKSICNRCNKISIPNSFKPMFLK